MNNKKYVPWGRTLTTQDNFLGKQRTNSKKKRPVVVIDNNKKNELAVVPLSSRKGANRTRLPKYQNGKSYFKHFVEIEDNEGRSIVVNSKFRENHKNMDVSQRDVSKIRNKVLFHSKTGKQNLEKLKILKNKKSRD